VSGGHGAVTRAEDACFEAALVLASVGLPVFPLARGGKMPAIPKREGGNGYHDATTDLDQIAGWWSRRPGSNVGLPTGEASGVLVLDVDNEEGRESLAEHTEDAGPFAPTRRHSTGRGGVHYLFAYPEDGTEIRSSCGAVAPGIDVRADGGYAVVPPSVTKAPYRSLGGSWLDLAPPPAWLVEMMLASSSRRTWDRGGNVAGGAVDTSPEGPPIREGRLLGSGARRHRPRGAKCIARR
jgi:putative DNA primase/helicase